MSSADISRLKSSALIVGGDQIDGIKQILNHHGIDQVNHWSGRKVGDSHKIIPKDTKIIVLITGWISHAFTIKVKKTAIKQGIKVIYTPNGSATLASKLQALNDDVARGFKCFTLNKCLTLNQCCALKRTVFITRIFKSFKGIHHGNSRDQCA